MIPINSDSPRQTPAGMALFQLGFRPFFLAAAAMAVFSMVIWMLDTEFSIRLLPAGNAPALWHAHEMIYGYALAIIAGFLLTAVKNWTSVQTLQGHPLQALLLLWLSARITALLPGQTWMITTAILNALFILALSAAVTIPVVQAKAWKNLGVVSKIYFFLPGSLLYSLDILGLFPDGQRIGIFIGLYMTLSLILVLARRVMPMFIERGVGYSVSLKNYRWVDLSCFLLFLIFAVADIFYDTPALTAWLALALCLLHSLRLYGWHTPGIWRKPLLWVLFIAYAWMIIGFGLKFAAFMFATSPSLAIHAFAAGGVAMMTLGMICRVSLGHTGRNIMQPPSGVGMMFLLLVSCAVVRVLLPLVLPAQYILWLGLSQALWIAAFGLFLLLYSHILLRPRIDGRPG